MNICFLTALMPNLTSGGIENVTFRLAIGLQDRGHNVHCLSLKSMSNIPQIPFPCQCIDQHEDANKMVLNYIKKNHIDIIINQSVEFAWFHILNDIKQKFSNIILIKTLHTDPAYLTKGIRDREPLYTKGGALSRFLYHISPLSLIRRYRRTQYAQMLYHDWLVFYDHIVLLSNNFINDFKHIARESNYSNISAISNPIQFSPHENLAKKEKIILYVGRIHREAKRPDRLLRIWEKIYHKHPDWKLIFIGEGPLRSELENYCIKNKILNISFIGECNPIKYYCQASILCITSTYEGFSLVCGEALANGVIPIAFDSFGAVKDLISNEYNGILIPPFNLKIYTTKLDELMSNQYYIDKLRNNILNNNVFAKQFSIDNILENWEHLFKHLKNRLSSQS